MTDQTPKQRQLELEDKCSGTAYAHYYAQLEIDKKYQREFEVGPGRMLAMTALQELIPAIEQLQAEGRAKLVQQWKTGARVGLWEMAIQALPATVLAYITLRMFFANIEKPGTTRASAAVGLGREVQLEMRYRELRIAERDRARKAGEYNRLEGLKRTVRQIKPRHVRKWIKRLDDIETTEWNPQVRYAVGACLFDTVVATLAHYFTVSETVTVQKRRTRHDIRVQLLPEVRDRLDEDHDVEALRSPLDLPMVAPPKPWKWNFRQKEYVGGYYTRPKSFLIHWGGEHTAQLITRSPKAISTVHREAVNAIQATRWRINTDVLAVAQRAAEEGTPEVMPVEPPKELPPRLAAKVWNTMTKEERGKYKNELSAIHDHNFKLEGKRYTLRGQLRLAEQFKDEEVIYFPYNIDFRGRVYAIPSLLNPQVDDFGRALLTFADKKPLGPTGLHWLMRHVANTYGIDKASVEKQVEWVEDHLNSIEEVAMDPLGRGLAFFAEADIKTRWQFLAAAIELAKVMTHVLEAPAETYECSLPIHVDGTCNGLQHLAAMGRDEVGGAAVNLVPADEPQDVYAIVAEKVADRVDLDTRLAYDADPIPEAQAWRGKVTRKTVKRAVMTTPYGVTKYGMREQFLRDGHCNGLEGDRKQNADYITSVAEKAIQDTIVKGSEIMEWLQQCAEIRAELGLDIRWRSPSGMEVRQAYCHPKWRAIITVFGTGRVLKTKHSRTLELSDDVAIRKQRLAIAPNVIHSFDAAHLVKVVERAVAEGLKAFYVVHDDFAVHAADMDRLSAILRSTFVDMYADDWFARLKKHFEAGLPAGVTLPDPPEFGSLVLLDVIKSEYFFA